MERMTRILCLVALLGVFCMTVSEGGKLLKRVSVVDFVLNTKYACNIRNSMDDIKNSLRKDFCIIE